MRHCNEPIVITCTGRDSFEARCGNFYATGTSPRVALKRIEAEMDGQRVPGRDGRPRVEIDPQRLTKLAAQGVTQSTMAHLLGLTHDGFQKRLAQDSRLRKAIERGRGEGVEVASSVLHRKAMSGDVKALGVYLKWMSRNRRPDPLDAYE